jgi:hypothetical protein
LEVFDEEVQRVLVRLAQASKWAANAQQGVEKQ